MASGRERVAWFNGSIVPESEAKVSFRDYGFSVGDGVFDTLRTFGHKPFLLDDHIARLYRSLRYVPACRRPRWRAIPPMSSSATCR